MNDSRTDLTHLRYIVYLDEQNKKQISLWTNAIVHASYARQNNIPPYKMTSLGYIGFHRGKWIIYEHYQLDGSNIFSEKREKILVQNELASFSEIHSEKLKKELEITYRQEKNLFLNEAKRMTAGFIRKIKSSLVRTRD